MLEHWADNLKNFVKVFPHEYKRILKARPAAEKKDMMVTAVPAQAIAVGERA
jgi:glutamate synthase domain-containing protein 3